MGQCPKREGRAIVKKLLGVGALLLATAGIGFLASKITAQNTAGARPADLRSKVALLNLSHVLKNYTKAIAIQNDLKPKPCSAKNRTKLLFPFTRMSKTPAAEWRCPAVLTWSSTTTTQPPPRNIGPPQISAENCKPGPACPCFIAKAPTSA